MNDRRIARALYWANGMLIVLVVLWMGWITARQIETGNTVADFTRIQIETVQRQNEAQLCGVHDTVIAVQKIGRKLGLPVSDIVAPDVTGIDCP